jgi:predicted metal-binding membrane protein
MPGAAGAWKMGIRHGLYCLGCCWMLMALLFYGGVMNLYWIIGLTAYIFLEKLVPRGMLVSRLASVVLIAWGALVLGGA